MENNAWCPRCGHGYISTGLAAEVARGDLHADINRAVAKALGLPFGESWSGMGDKVSTLLARVAELEGLLREWWDDNPPDICSCDSDKECDGTCWCQRVRQVLKRDEIDAAVSRAALGGEKEEE